MPLDNKKTILLCILDGWGYSEKTTGNAIATANTPTWDEIWSKYPHTLLDASGESVGLPSGQMGNSEVGHITMGSGRVILQDLPRINRAIENSELEANATITGAIAKLKETGGACHLMGLLSDGGVHSHQEHIVALAKIFAKSGIKVYIHAFLDGRDTPPKSAITYIKRLIDDLDKDDNLYKECRVEIASMSGRFFAMDRDKRWDRIELAYNAISPTSITNNNTQENTKTFEDPLEAIESFYNGSKDGGTNFFDGKEIPATDEFFIPESSKEYTKVGIDKSGKDVLLMANFRADRAREILTKLIEKEKFAKILGMVEYDKILAHQMETIFPPIKTKNTLGEFIAAKKLRQLRIAETEKYAHVTYFFNAGEETAFEREDRILVPSPKVATYDKQPEMSAARLTEKLIQAIKSQKYSVIIANYANPDMVGHTGNFKAAVKAVEAIDECLKKVKKAILDIDGKMLITADHGNVEEMLDENGNKITSHSLNKVPFVYVGNDYKNIKLRNCDNSNNNNHTKPQPEKCGLYDISPTILKLLFMIPPKEMEGKSLII